MLTGLNNYSIVLLQLFLEQYITFNTFHHKEVLQIWPKHPFEMNINIEENLI